MFFNGGSPFPPTCPGNYGGITYIKVLGIGMNNVTCAGTHTLPLSVESPWSGGLVLCDMPPSVQVTVS